MKDRRSDDDRPGGFFYIQAASYFIIFICLFSIFVVLDFGKK